MYVYEYSVLLSELYIRRAILRKICIGYLVRTDDAVCSTLQYNNTSQVVRIIICWSFGSLHPSFLFACPLYERQQEYIVVLRN